MHPETQAMFYSLVRTLRSWNLKQKQFNSKGSIPFGYSQHGEEMPEIRDWKWVKNPVVE
ncbi:MAG: hypothetical protein WKF35_08440 [Ferruginibacter sp.]